MAHQFFYPVILTFFDEGAGVTYYISGAKLSFSKSNISFTFINWHSSVNKYFSAHQPFSFSITMNSWLLLFSIFKSITLIIICEAQIVSNLSSGIPFKLASVVLLTCPH